MNNLLSRYRVLIDRLPDVRLRGQERARDMLLPGGFASSDQELLNALLAVDVSSSRSASSCYPYRYRDALCVCEETFEIPYVMNNEADRLSPTLYTISTDLSLGRGPRLPIYFISR
jgi:hypothetical protein